MKLTRHVGFDANTNARIVLLVPILEGSESCLVAYTDSLPNELREVVLYIVNSDAGQREIDLSKALSTQLFSDSGVSVLQTLHLNGYIQKVAIDNVLMSPSNAYKMPLREVLVASGLLKQAIDQMTVDKFNPHQHNANAAVHGETVGTAKNLILEADLLDQAARDKREQAYRLAPQLRPAATREVPTQVLNEGVPAIDPASLIQPIETAEATGDATGEKID